ncbi:MAG: hypothetical protein ACPL5F_01880 [Moorellaceae bacterium]
MSNEGQSIARRIKLATEGGLRGSLLCQTLKNALLKLAEEVSVQGVVVGHIKVLLTEGENFALLSCTRPSRVEIQASENMDTAMLREPVLHLAAIVANFPEEKLGGLLDQCILSILRFLSDELLGKEDGQLRVLE